MKAERFARGSRGLERPPENLEEIRRELENVRRAEARALETVESLRAARDRLEALARSLDVEERGTDGVLRGEVAAEGGGTGSREGAPAGADPDAGSGSGRNPSAPPRRDGLLPTSSAGREGWRSALPAVVALSLLAVTVGGWLAFRAYRSAPAGPKLVVVDDEPFPWNGEAEAAMFFARLPAQAEALVPVYDSLLAARSPLLSPFVEQVRAGSPEPEVRGAAAAWEAGPLDPGQADALHSAMVQVALARRTGEELDVDGRVLRDPCRGASCGALLRFWQDGGEAAGLPGVPEDAPLDAAALRMAEAVLVLGTLREMHRTRAAGPRGVAAASGEHPPGS